MMTYTEFLHQMFNLLDEADLHGALYWRASESFEGIQWYIGCNDLFWWATSDAEPITPANLHLFREAIEQIKAVGGPVYCASELFCAKARGMRPQGAAYPKDEPLIWPLFDACGPARETDNDNPRPAPVGEAKEGEQR